MFTGIIEEVGIIKAVKHGVKSSRLEIEAHHITADLKHGDSVATQGVCLTVNNLNANVFSVDVMSQTLKNSALGQLKSGDKVNLERALSLKTRLGGHIVAGHVDCVGTITNITQDDIAKRISIKIPYKHTKYIIEKGSICIDGISLTVAELQDDTFTVSLIPVTQQDTTLIHKKEGDLVNVELDQLAKYTERLLNFKDDNTEKSAIDTNFLKEHGFI